MYQALVSAHCDIKVCKLRNRSQGMCTWRPWASSAAAAASAAARACRPAARRAPAAAAAAARVCTSLS